MKISESLALAKFNTISSDSVSSGFGDLTVGKFPLGEACSSTIFKFLYPACLSTSGPILYEVPCRGVKAILKFALLDVPIFPFFIESFIKFSSILLSINSINSSFFLKFMDE